MAATSRRIALLAGVALAVVGLVAIGPCRRESAADPLPPPAIDGLDLQAELHDRTVDLTVRLDPAADRAIEVPDVTVPPVWDALELLPLAHRGKDADGTVVLAVGRGRIESEWETGSVRLEPATPALVAPGDTVAVEAEIVPTWMGRDRPADATAEELDEADVVRVCLWGVLHPVGAAPTTESDWEETRQLGCVDVER